MKLLIVDSDRSASDILRTYLESELYIVDQSFDGIEGSSFARLNAYDVILMSTYLPAKDVYDVCRDIRSSNIHTPIIILSHDTSLDIKMRLFNEGIDDFIPKPCIFIELALRIRALMRRPRVRSPEILSARNIVLNTTSHTVCNTKLGKNISLTRKEFNLFELLLRNRGCVLSRSMIMEYVWDVNADPFSNTIESHILSLRQKIGDKKDHKIIKTVPGIGYMIP